MLIIYYYTEMHSIKIEPKRYPHIESDITTPESSHNNPCFASKIVSENKEEMDREVSIRRVSVKATDLFIREQIVRLEGV